MAKRYHPDARSSERDAVYEPDVERFRNVIEAYQVLSVRESRATFDLSRRKNPEKYNKVMNEDYNLKNRRDIRDANGNITKPAPKRGSYAEQRVAELKKERARYNVNDLGYYNGGVPRKNRGMLRGDALAEPGHFH